MRAVIIASGECPAIAPMNERCPVSMLPLVDRPFLQHIIEYLAVRKVTRFDFVLSHLPEKIESYLGDGTRWGSRFTYHLAREPSQPYRRVRTMSFDPGSLEPVLLLHADRLPPIQRFDEPGTLFRGPVLFCAAQPNGPETVGVSSWTGWALVTPRQLLSLPAEADEAAVEAFLRAIPDHACQEVGATLSMRTFAAILQSHHAVLNKQFSGLLLAGREISPGIWLARNVVLHPTARIQPPVYIGENCQINDGVQLGPQAVVGNDCVLDTRCIVSGSAILAGSYIGEGLELADVIVDKNRLINARFGSAVTVTDDFILGSMSENQLRQWLTVVIGRLIGIAGLLLVLPVLLATALWLKLVRRGPVLFRKEVVHLPAPSEERDWHTYFLWSYLPDTTEERARSGQQTGSWRNLVLRFLPALVNVARGQLSLVGVPPRSREEIAHLSHDWRCLYLHSKGGIVGEAAVRYGTHPTEDELYSAEGYYAVTGGLRHDVKLLLLYFGRTFFGFLRTRIEVEPAEGALGTPLPPAAPSESPSGAA